MVRYEVTVETTPELSAAFESYMRQKHIPEIFAVNLHATWPDRTQAVQDRAEQHRRGYRFAMLLKQVIDHAARASARKPLLVGECRT